MKVYVAYIMLDLKVNNRFPYIIESGNTIKIINNKLIALYGFTNKKKLMKEFKKTRNDNVFYYKTFDMSISTFLDYRRRNHLYELQKNLFGYNEITVFIEYIMMTEGTEEALEMYMEKTIPKFDVSIFSNKTFDILNDIDYVYPEYYDLACYYSKANVEDTIILFIICFSITLDPEFTSSVMNKLK